MRVDPRGRSPELLETLDAEACARFLEATEFGRLAVIAADRPKIIVLNHVIDGADIVFRTRNDSVLAELTRGGSAVPAAYEVDSAFPVGRSGWSVIAAGELVRETDPRRVSLARSAIVSWAEGDRDLVLRLDVHELTGRRVGPL